MQNHQRAFKPMPDFALYLKRVHLLRCAVSNERRRDLILNKNLGIVVVHLPHDKSTLYELVITLLQG